MKCAAWGLVVALGTIIAISLLWVNYEPRETTVEFENDFEERIATHFPNVVFHRKENADGSINPHESWVELLERIYDTLKNRERAEALTFHSASSPQLFINSVAQNDILVFVEELEERMQSKNDLRRTGVERVYLARMEQRDNFVVYIERYNFPTITDSWTIESLSHEKAVFHYDNKDHLQFSTMIFLVFGLIIGSGVIVMMYPGAATQKRHPA